jgi:RecB family exonuclease
MLVPTYSQAEHLRYALLDRTGGISQRVIHTFTSLAEHFGGCRLGELVSEARRDRIAGAVLADHFPAAAGQPGFRAEFLAAVKEIKEQAVRLDVAIEHAQAQFPEGHRGRLLFEAARDYAVALAASGLDHEDLLLRTRDWFESSAPPLDLLLVDGFHDFTPVQQEIVDRLASAADETVVTLPLDDSPVFRTAARTAEAFAGYSRERLEVNRRAAGLLGDLESKLAQVTDGGMGGGADGENARILAAASDDDEADRLARHVALSGRPPKDFLLVRRSFVGLHALYRAAFLRYGIPIRFFGPEPLAEGALGRALAVFLRTRIGPVPSRDLLPLLRSPFLLDGQPNQEAEDVARAIRTQGARIDWGAFPGSAALLAADERPLAAQLRAHFGLSRALVAVPDGDRELTRAARLLEALGQEADSTDATSLEQAARTLLRRLPQLRAALPDRRHDCVFAVEAKEARQWEKPVVLAAGLDAGSFPHAVRQDLFLRDDERRELADRGFALPLRERLEDEERYLFYVVMTRAKEQLVLSWSAFDEDGTPVPASPFLDDLRASFPDVPERRVKLAEQYVPAAEAVRRADLLPIVADGLARVDRIEGGRGSAAALAAALHDREPVMRDELAWPRRLELLRARPILDLPADPAATLSASRIKAYERCPFLYLVRGVLRVEPERAEALDPLLRGDIVHKVLERVAEGGDPDAEFDRVVAEATAHLRLDLQGSAEMDRMREYVGRGVDTLRGAEVGEVEHAFKTPIGDIVLRGRIDRIDRVPEGELVRDYKTGNVTDKDDVQLDAYLLAVEHPAGALFDLLKTGGQRGYVLDSVPGDFPKKVERVSREALEERRAAMRERVARIAKEVREGRLYVHPEDPDTCARKTCDGFDLCRVARARWLRRVEREGDA